MHSVINWGLLARPLVRLDLSQMGFGERLS